MKQVDPIPNGSSPAGTPSAGAAPLNLSVEERLARLENVFNSAPVGLCFIDLTYRYVTVNTCFAAMYDLTCGDFIGRTVREALPSVAEQIMAHLEDTLATESSHSIELTLTRFVPETGLPRGLVYLRTPQIMRDATGAMIGFSVVLVDITERKAAERALRESEENHRHALEYNPHIPWTICAAGSISVSARFLQLTGLQADEVTIQTWVETIHVDDREQVMAAWMDSARTGAPFDSVYRLYCTEGLWRWMRSRAFPRKDSQNEIIRWYGTLEDIHERTLLDDALRNKTARLEEVSDELALLVREDHLTGLANRRHFDDALRREMTRARRSHQPLALILFDVDHFKRFNDSYGHPAGDLCLRDVGQALKNALRRQGDVAARYGGEEFVILLPDTPEEGALEVARLAANAVRALHISHVASETGFLTISAGVAAFEPANDSTCCDQPGTLTQMADIALYAAKAAGRNRAVGAGSLNLPGKAG